MSSSLLLKDLKASGRNPKPTCVSVYARTARGLSEEIERALAFNPAYVELRLDYLRDVLVEIQRLAKRKRRANEIFTFRARREGGISSISDKIRRLILSEIISEISPPILDIEMNTLVIFPEVRDSLRRSRSKLIVSSHDFARTDPTEKLENLILGAARRYSPSFVKIVRQANDFSDNLRILSLYKLSDKIKPARLVAFCSGPLGIFSRIACVSYGSPFTFASLPNKKTAPGQLDVNSMNLLLDCWK
jgi:3-dehydroquinate dehydratase I